MSATDQAVSKGMLSAGWSMNMINEVQKAIKENGGTASAQIDTDSVSVKCKNGKRVFI
jgi:hypothetical protein